MTHHTIYELMSVQALMPPAQLRDLELFLVQNRAYLLSSAKKAEAFRTRHSGQTLMDDLITRLVAQGADQMFALLQLPTKAFALREVIDFNFVPFDLQQIAQTLSAETKSVALLPELHNKMVINITDITKASGEFSDLGQFHDRVVRDFLSRHYATDTAQAWISPRLVRYVAKVYSMTIGGRLARTLNLSAQQQAFVQTVFALFYVGQMTKKGLAADFVKDHMRYLGVPAIVDVTQILAFVEDQLAKSAPETLEDVCQVLGAYGIRPVNGTETSRVNRAVLNVAMASLYQDSHVSMIALEYPPYFLFLILLVLSHQRIGLSFSMKQMSVTTEGTEVIGQLVRSPFWIGASQP